MASQLVIFFGGQGGRSSGDTLSAATLKVNENTSSLTLLLSACHSAFLEETIKARKGSTAPSWVRFDVFPSPERLLVLSPEQSTNPILQGVSLCLNQLSAYLNYNNGNFQSREPVAAVGFCSGMLPAAVVACSESLDEYIDYSKQSIRTAFWIGYRAAELSSKIAGSRWNERPWAMSVIGKTQEALLEEIEAFNQTSEKIIGHETISLGNGFGNKGFSIVGPGHLLDQFRSRYQSGNTVYSPIPVYGLYHAGKKSVDAVEAVLTDLNGILNTFPPTSKLKKALWSCHGSESINAAGLPEQTSLLRCILNCILVEQADLLTTWRSIVKEIDLSNSSWNVVTIGDGARTLLSTANKDIPSSSKFQFTDIPRLSMNPDLNSGSEFAVVGMSVNFPSGLGKAQFWQMLEEGLNTVQEVPGTRFNIDEYQTGNSGHRGSKREMKARYGNFIDDPFSFDHEFFNISPRESKSMDPQQKVLLQGAVRALDDAGYVPYSTPSYDPETMACYVGIATEDYVQNLSQDIDVYYSTGTLRAFLSGRISYAFGWSGPSVVIDTACSSSTVAIANACRALAAGDCSAALAGGANVITSPDMYIGLSRAHFLSSSGQCKPFDAGADGYCRSEGCGLFVIKRLEDAVRENDRIYGVIKGIESNQSGNASSITHPHAETQQSLFQKVLSSSKIDPATISVIEAHGTGTQAGDGTEASSINSVFGGLSDVQSVYLTSIKGSIGHAEAASGAASLAKLLLMMQNATIPPQVGFKNLNPKLESLLAKNFHIADRATEWRTPRNIPKRALLNNFGAAGSNATLILEEQERQTSANSKREPRSTYVFNLSAKTERALKTFVQRHVQFLQRKDRFISVEDTCYTATARRRLYEWRLSLTVTSSDNLLEQLSNGPAIVQCVDQIRHPVVFVFSGQGAFHTGMAKSLISTSPFFCEKVRECDHILENYGLPSVMPVFQGSSSSYSTPELVVWSQVATFVLEYAMASLWLSWGFKPDVVIGHSLGEFAAMAFAETLSLKDALGIVLHRAQLMADLCQCGESGMLACESSASFVETILVSNDFQTLSIACDNGATSCVVSGPNQDLDRLAQVLRSQEIRNKILSVPLGFHSKALDPILQPLGEHCRDVSFHPPKYPMGSCFHGRTLEPNELTPNYFVQQTRGMIRFRELLESLRETGLSSGIFVEVGPHPITLPMINSMFRDDKCLSLPSIVKGKEAWEILCSSLREISLQEIPIKWREVFDGTDATITDIPEYPFEGSSHYIPFSEMRHQTNSHASQATPMKPDSFKLLDNIAHEARSDTDVPSKFSSELTSLSKYIVGHVVGDVPLCPASVYIECILEAAHWDDKFNGGVVLTVSDIDFGLPLLYSQERGSHSINLTFENGVPICDPLSETRLTKRKFVFTQSLVSDSNKDSEAALCSGWAEWELVKDIDHLFGRKSAYIRRQIAHLQAPEAKINIFRTKALYQIVFPRVVSYGAEFQTIKELKVLEDGLEAYGTFSIPWESGQEGGVLTPVFVDTLLHAAGFVVNSYLHQAEACICTKVESVKVLYQNLNLQQNFQVYASLLECDNGIFLGEAYAATVDGTVVGSVEGMHFKKLNLKSFKAHLSRQLSRDSPHLMSSEANAHQSRPDREYRREKIAEIRVPQPKHHDMNVAQLVLGTICQICERPLESVQSSSTLLNLGIDSMMRIELGNLLAKKLVDLNLDLDHMTNIDTVLQLQEYVQEQAIKTESYKCDASDTTQESSIDGSSTPADDTPSGISSRSETPPATKDIDNLYQIISQTCEIPVLKIDSQMPLQSLGTDSLMIIELQEALQQQFGQSLPDDHSVFDWTIQDLINYLGLNKVDKGNTSNLQQGNNDNAKNPHSIEPVLTHLQNGDPSLPTLILFHDGSGTIEYYKKLKDLGNNVFAIKNPVLAKDHWANNLTDMADLYASTISSALKGPLILGGWSFGGVLAHEVAQCLECLDRKVLAVIMIDSPCPEKLVPLPSPIVKYVLKEKSLSPSTETVITSQFQKHAQLLAEYSSKQGATQEVIPKERKYFMLYCQDTINTSQLCGVDHPWLSDKNSREQALNNWKQILGRSLTVLRIPGNHFEVFEPANINAVSQQLQQSYTSAIEGLH